MLQQNSSCLEHARVIV